VNLKILGRRKVLVGALVAATLMGVTTASIALASGKPAIQRAHPGSISSFSVDPPLTAVYLANNKGDFKNPSTTLIPILGMSVKFKVGHRAQLIMHFTDEAGCLSRVAGHWCVVEILVDGVEAAPGDSLDYAIDSSDGSGMFKWIGAALNRNTTVAAGAHTVTVVYAPRFKGDTAWTGENSLEVWVF